MKISAVLIGLLMIATLAPTRVETTMSDLSGIHAVVEKVVFEPSESAPERVQIWGAFSIAGRGPTPPPQRGYLYLGLPPIVMECTTCPPASAATENAKKEWADLKSVAGTGQGVAFGARFFQGRVRSQSEKPATPDRYPVFMGVAKLGNHPIVAELNKALQARF
jgi:hypothetical protein